MKRRFLLPLSAMLLLGLACGQTQPASDDGAPERAASSPTTPSTSVFDNSETAFGFFPSPPEPSTESVLGHFETLGEDADFILIQPNIPWQDFVESVEGDPEQRQDLRNQVTLARQNGLEWIFVVDPLNGLNRRQFFQLPSEWKPSFADPNVRSAYRNFSLWLVREFDPTYLGLASEINTYMDAHPDDVEHFVALYRDTYDAVKDEAPGTNVFVTFQWDDLQNAFPGANEGRPAYDTNWDQVELFEPQLDVWAISSYPYFIFNGGTPIPGDYYTPLLERTDKPLAVAEGGFASRPVRDFELTPADQVAYLHAIHDQIGSRLDFWVNLLLTDLNMEAIGDVMREQGREGDIEGLSLFGSIGLRHVDGAPKPALDVWNGYRR